MLDALEKGELQAELLEDSEKLKPQIIKSSVKSGEMTGMENNHPIHENGIEKGMENGDHKIGQ